MLLVLWTDPGGGDCRACHPCRNPRIRFNSESGHAVYTQTDAASSAKAAPDAACRWGATVAP